MVYSNWSVRSAIAVAMLSCIGSNLRGEAATPNPALTARAAARFLDQSTFGPTLTSTSELQAMGIRGWLDWQFSIAATDLPDQPIAATDLRPVQQAFFQNSIGGQDQLRQRVTFALSQIFAVSASFVGVYSIPPYWRALRDNAFGNYRDILRTLTLNPTMGGYLDLPNSRKADSAAGTVPNTNYARELMQLFTIGLVRLNIDGSPLLDLNQRTVPTFDEGVVANVARALTGWTYPTAPGAPPLDLNPPYYIGRLIPVERNHDTGSKLILNGTLLPPGQTVEQDLESVIDALMRESTMAPFVSKQLIQHLVTSNPTPEYVERVSQVFQDNGSGLRGDMKKVITAILTDPEARAGDEPSALPNSFFGHLREPVLYVVSVLRGLNVTTRHGNSYYYYADLMGQHLFRPPSVFGYFSPRYRVSDRLLGPEFQILTTHTALARVNFIDTVLFGAFGTIDLAPFQDVGNDPQALVDLIGDVFLHGSMSPDLRTATLIAIDGLGGLTRVKTALYIVLTAAEYQVVH